MSIVSVYCLMKNKTVLFLIFASVRQTLCFIVSFYPKLKLITFSRNSNENAGDDSPCAVSAHLAAHSLCVCVCVFLCIPLFDSYEDPNRSETSVRELKSENIAPKPFVLPLQIFAQPKTILNKILLWKNLSDHATAGATAGLLA